MKDKTLKIAVIGAGTRGNSLAMHIKSHSLAQVVAVAEPRSEPKELFTRNFDISPNAVFQTWQEMAESSVVFDAAVITTLDNAHTEPAVAFLKKGCHLLIEKPMADTEENCIKILNAQKKADKIVAVCHTLRFKDGFMQVKQIISQGIIGKIITVNHSEEIGNLRFTHNYVRGKWGNTKSNTNLLLHKSCHDLDLIAWLIGSKCKKVSSFGRLSFFSSEMAPKHSADRCIDKCSLETQCAYSAIKLYVQGDLDKWPANTITRDHTAESNYEEIKEGPFGLCVWHSGKDVVDHQVVAMEFECGATATFTMSGFTVKNRRALHVHGSLGELFLDDDSKEIIITEFAGNTVKKIILESSNTYHPEDEIIINNWLTAISKNDQGMVEVSSDEAYEKLKIVFAAEKSRSEGRTIEFRE
ncbi:MAG: Gfo/Idh/MocA family oxidoreductase [Bacteroidota bacterium]